VSQPATRTVWLKEPLSWQNPACLGLISDWSEGWGREESTVKHAEIISKEESTGLWDKGVMGANSPSSQLNAVFSGSGGEEHRNLKLSCERWYNPDHSIYTEIAQIFLLCGHF